MPISAEEAWDLTDPSLPEAQRESAAQNIMTGVAANDAYLDSRPALERLMALAQNEQVPPPHGDLNPSGDNAPVETPAPPVAVEAGPAQDDPPVDGTAVVDPFPAEDVSVPVDVPASPEEVPVPRPQISDDLDAVDKPGDTPEVAELRAKIRMLEQGV